MTGGVQNTGRATLISRPRTRL